MATFEAKVYKLRIEEHPNADSLELAVVGDYRSIVRKGQFKTGDLGVYIPEAAVLPEWLIDELGLTGKLAGKDKNRVKAIKLRGILSQGLVYPVVDGTLTLYTTDKQFLDESEMDAGEGRRDATVTEGQVVTDLLEITKYEPPIPVHMAGEVFNAHGYTLNYDIENIKKFPNVLTEKDPVLITEKLHGTWTCFGYHPDVNQPIVTSKGLSGRGLAFKFNDANQDNLYIRSFMSTTDSLGRTIIDRVRDVLVDGLPVYILGETFGRGVQDLHYGLDKPAFRAFDIYVGSPGEGRYLNGAEFLSVCGDIGVEPVPILYTGGYSREIVEELTNGKDTVTGAHIREGVVIRGLVDDMRHDELGRVILKSVSEAYLLRGGEATEFN